MWRPYLANTYDSDGETSNITDIRQAVHNDPCRRGHIMKIVCEIGYPTFALLLLEIVVSLVSRAESHKIYSILLTPE